MAVALLDDNYGEVICVGCGLCAAICPTRVIHLSPGPLAPSPRTGQTRGWPATFTLDASGCIACELCIQVCPTDAIRLWHDPARATNALLDLDALRAAAQHVHRGRHRSPLGPVPVPRGSQGPTEAGLGIPRPAVDLGPDPNAATPRLTEDATGEATEIENWAHPVDARTDPDSAGLQGLNEADEADEDAPTEQGMFPLPPPTPGSTS